MPGLYSWKAWHKLKCENCTQIPHLKQCISLGLWDWQLDPKYCMTIPLVDIWTCRVYMYCIYSIHTCLYSIHTFLYSLFISNAIKYKRLTVIAFGMVYSDRTVVVLLHKHFNSWLSTPITLSAWSWIVHTLSESNFMAYVNNSITNFVVAYYV